MKFARFLSRFSIAGLLAPALSGQPCPAIDFLTARQAILDSSNEITAVLRESDSSYTGLRISKTAPFRLLETIPNYLERFRRCLPASTDTRPAPAIASPQLAAASRHVVIPDFLNDGTGLIASIAFARNMVSVILADSVTLTFRAMANYPAGVSPRAVVAVDLNGDGRRELVAVNTGDGAANRGNVSVLLARSDNPGTFQGPVNYPAGDTPRHAAAADFNGDGRADLAVANFFSDNVSILLGDGDGTFRAPVNYPTGRASNAVTIADFNGDGRVDVAAVSQGPPGLVAILAGNGDGTFRLAVSFAVDGMPESAAAGDFNKDGKADLAVSDRQTQTMTVYLGNGTLGFQSVSRYSVGFRPDFLQILDLDRDGNSDVVAATGAPGALVYGDSADSAVILYGKGDGTFHGAPNYIVAQAPGALTVGDFNGDQRPDLAVASRTSPNVAIFNGTGGDRLQPAPALNVRFPGGEAAVPAALLTTDFQRDGRTDLVVFDAVQNTLAVFQGNGDNTFRAPATYGLATPTNSLNLGAALLTGDFNSDGAIDVVVTNEGQFSPPFNGHLTLFAGKLDSTLESPVVLRAMARFTAVATADFNRDGKQDLVVVSHGAFTSMTDPGSVQMLLGNGNGTFQPPVDYPVGVNPRFLAVADFNGDRLPDLAVTTGGPPRIALLTGNGDGTFKPAQFFPTAAGPSGIVAGDFNGDLRPDLIVAHCCGAADMTFLAGNGDGTFPPYERFIGGADVSALAAQDLNADRVPDLVVLNSPSSNLGGVTVLMNNSPRTGVPAHVSAASFLAGPVAPESIVSAFGTRLAAGLLVADSFTLPVRLGTTAVKVRDSGGVERDAGLYFASPGQVNYLMPPGTTPGTATVTITTADGTPAAAAVAVSNVAPALFQLNAQRLAAAIVLRVREDGTRSVEPVTAPIDVATDQVFLILFATGVRNHTGLSGVSVRIGGPPAEVLYAGPQGVFTGLDQVNVLLPRALRGRGEVDVLLTVEGRTSNAARISVR